jgi:hypothetical protein
MADLESKINERMNEIAETLKSRPKNEREYLIYFNACSINLAYLMRTTCLLQESLGPESTSPAYDSYARKYEKKAERFYNERKKLLENKEDKRS